MFNGLKDLPSTTTKDLNDSKGIPSFDLTKLFKLNKMKIDNQLNLSNQNNSMSFGRNNLQGFKMGLRPEQYQNQMAIHGMMQQGQQPYNYAYVMRPQMSESDMKQQTQGNSEMFQMQNMGVPNQQKLSQLMQPMSSFQQMSHRDSNSL